MVGIAGHPNCLISKHLATCVCAKLLQNDVRHRSPSCKACCKMATNCDVFLQYLEENFTVIAWNLRERPVVKHIHSFSTVKDVRIIFTKIGRWISFGTSLIKSYSVSSSISSISGSITDKNEKKRWHLKDKIKLLYLNEYSISTS